MSEVASETSTDLPKVLPSASDGKHYSITQSIALEHQLMADDEPTAASLNPEVLSSIIVSMRESFAHERSNFEATLADASAKSASLESRCADAEERLHDTEAKLKDAETKIAEQEHSLAILRQTLEESRRGIMRLQTENKRVSVMGTPSSATNGQGSTSRANKRLSLNPSIPLPPLSQTVPRTPRTHRRISSLSDPGVAQDISNQLHPSSPPAGASTLLLPEANPRRSLSASPPSVDQPLPDPEVVSLKAELAQLKRALQEAFDARMATEEVVKGLRELIAAHSTEEGVMQPSPGLSGLRLPPLPSDPYVELHEDPPKVEQKKSGWASLRLWREQSGGTLSTTAPNPPPPPPKFDRTSSSTSAGSDPENTGASSSIPAATALTGFMSWRRGSSATAPASAETAINGSAPPSGVVSPTSETASSAPSSFRSKFGFFAKAPAANGETASILSSRPTSISTSEFPHGHGPPNGTDNNYMVHVIIPGNEEEHPPTQEIILQDESGDLKPDAPRGDMTPTTGADNTDMVNVIISDNEEHPPIQEISLQDESDDLRSGAPRGDITPTTGRSGGAL